MCARHGKNDSDPEDGFLSSADPAQVSDGDVERWATTDAAWYGRLALAGAALPFLFDSLFTPEQRLVWPWNLFAQGGAGLTVLIAIPVAVAMLGFPLRKLVPVKPRSTMYFALGFVSLATLALVPYDEEVYLLGAPFLAFPRSIKLFALALVLGAGAVAVGNRVRKRHPASVLARALAAGGGIAILALLSMPALGEVLPAVQLFRLAAWRADWALNLLVLSVGVYAAIGIAHGVSTSLYDVLGSMLSVQARITLVWIPFSLLLVGERLGTDLAAFFRDPSKTATCLAVVKCGATFYGLILIMATGMAGFIAAKLDERRPAGAPDASPAAEAARRRDLVETR